MVRLSRRGPFCGTRSPAPSLPGGDLRYRGYGSERAIRVVRPDSGAPARGAALFLHGGDFSSGSVDAATPLAADIARRLQVTVAIPDYTRAPECPFPAAAEDAYAALVWLHTQARAGGWPADALIVAGEEAGGNLAAVAALMCRDRGVVALSAQVLVSPMLDPSLSSGSMQCAAEGGKQSLAARCAAAYRRYLPRIADHLHPYAAPVQCRRLAGLPPALILSAADDPLREEAGRYGAALIAAGVTTQVAQLPAVRTADGAWTAETWAAVAAFVEPRLQAPRSRISSHTS